MSSKTWLTSNKTGDVILAADFPVYEGIYNDYIHNNPNSFVSFEDFITDVWSPDMSVSVPLSKEMDLVIPENIPVLESLVANMTIDCHEDESEHDYVFNSPPPSRKSITSFISGKEDDDDGFKWDSDEEGEGEEDDDDGYVFNTPPSKRKQNNGSMELDEDDYVFNTPPSKRRSNETLELDDGDFVFSSPPSNRKRTESVLSKGPRKLSFDGENSLYNNIISISADVLVNYGLDTSKSIEKLSTKDGVKSVCEHLKEIAKDPSIASELINVDKLQSSSDHEKLQAFSKMTVLANALEKMNFSDEAIQSTKNVISMAEKHMNEKIETLFSKIRNKEVPTVDGLFSDLRESVLESSFAVYANDRSQAPVNVIRSEAYSIASSIMRDIRNKASGRRVTVFVSILYGICASIIETEMADTTRRQLKKITSSAVNNTDSGNVNGILPEGFIRNRAIGQIKNRMKGVIISIADSQDSYETHAIRNGERIGHNVISKLNGDGDAVIAFYTLCVKIMESVEEKVARDKLNALLKKFGGSSVKEHIVSEIKNEYSLAKDLFQACSKYISEKGLKGKFSLLLPKGTDSNISSKITSNKDMLTKAALAHTLQGELEVSKTISSLSGKKYTFSLNRTINTQGFSTQVPQKAQTYASDNYNIDVYFVNEMLV